MTPADLPAGHPLVATVMAKKGGTGKTGITQGVASAARNRGTRTWCVDFDPQMNLTRLLNPKKYLDELAAAEASRSAGQPARDPAGLADVLNQQVGLLDALYPAGDAWSGLMVVPASKILDNIERTVPTQDSPRIFRTALIAAIEQLPPDERPELVLCDTRPAFNLLTVQALVAAQLGLVAVEPERFSLEGLVDAWGTLTALHQSGNLPWLIKAAVLLTQVDKRESEHRDRKKEVQEAFGPVLWDPELPDRTVIAQAISAGVPLHDYPDDRAKEPVKVFDAWLAKILETRAVA